MVTNRHRPTNALLALAAVLALSGTAMAKPSPFERQMAEVTIAAHDDTPIMMRPAGATLERDYFRAPATPFAAQRIFPCRLQLRLFEKTRLAQTCN